MGSGLYTLQNAQGTFRPEPREPDWLGKAGTFSTGRARRSLEWRNGLDDKELGEKEGAGPDSGTVRCSDGQISGVASNSGCDTMHGQCRPRPAAVVFF